MRIIIKKESVQCTHNNNEMIKKGSLKSHGMHIILYSSTITFES